MRSLGSIPESMAAANVNGLKVEPACMPMVPPSSASTA